MEELVRRTAKRLIRLTRYNSSMWSGDYPDWASAMRHCTGYHADAILDRCQSALRQVLEGKAAYERDSLLFNDTRLCWELLAVAYQTAARYEGRVSVLDFGGSLGSLYFQHRRWLDDIPLLDWHVVEQPHFVDCGRREVKEGRLRFYYDIAESAAASLPNLLLLSGVLQAMDDPRAWIAKFNQLDIPHIVIDRLPIAEASDRDVLTVQKVPSHIYEASYPAWFFSEAQFLAAFTNYRMAGAFQSQYDDNQWVGGRRCRFRGYVMERINHTGA